MAHRESETAEERRQYAYTQSVRLQEIDGRGTQTGEYREVREVIFSPTGDRTERFSGQPVSRLKNLVMTPEDFADIRNIQPFVMTEDQLWIYEIQYKGEERDRRPRLLGALDSPAPDPFGAAAVRRNAVDQAGRFFGDPQRRKGRAGDRYHEDRRICFPRFTTIRRPVNGFWFPAVTSADDTLYFRSAPIREKLVIRYDDYKKFGSDTTITFEK